MKNQRYGRWVPSLIDWGLANWYRIGWAIFGCYMMHAVHSFLDIYNIMGGREYEFMDYLTKSGTLS